jgi:hypothetical protein
MVQEAQPDLPHRAVALFRQDQFRRALQILPVSFVHFLAIDKYHYVGILLD